MEKIKLSDYDYTLPPELIAQEPLDQRDSSRMLVLDRSSGNVEHNYFNCLPDKLQPGDLLVMNNTRVIPARLIGRISGKKTEAEILLLNRNDNGSWVAMVKPGSKLKPGTIVELADQVQALVEDYTAERGMRVIRFQAPVAFEKLLPLIGRVPLPPYIKTEIADPERYQTVYAAVDGSAAAPTAGFHFTDGVFENLRSKGIDRVYVTLHIGPGTFQPVKTEDIRDHQMHSESFYISEETAQRLNETRKEGGRIVAVGTTVSRVLETTVGSDGYFSACEGLTGLYIYPGFQFRAVDLMLTNFHLPHSSLLMLVCALAGYREIMAAYREAVEKRYRFYSFGDCMLIL